MIVRGILSGFMLALLACDSVFALSCGARPQSPEEIARAMDDPGFLLMDVRVLDVAYPPSATGPIIDSGDEGTTTFEILVDWLDRMGDTNQIAITHYLHQPANGLMFEPGSELLLFARRFEGRLRVSTCYSVREETWGLWRRIAWTRMRREAAE